MLTYSQAPLSDPEHKALREMLDSPGFKVFQKILASNAAEAQILASTSAIESIEYPLKKEDVQELVNSADLHYRMLGIAKSLFENQKFTTITPIINDETPTAIS